jgi:hypothetical protein
MINHVEEILNRSKEIHLKKREDYATDATSNPFENFDRANIIISWFPAEYASFAGHIGTKLARLGSLLLGRKTPNNESIDDSFLDLVTYCALFYGYWKEKNTTDRIEKEHTPKFMTQCKFNLHDFNIDGICNFCGMSYTVLIKSILEERSK